MPNTSQWPKQSALPLIIHHRFRACIEENQAFNLSIYSSPVLTPFTHGIYTLNRSSMTKTAKPEFSVNRRFPIQCCCSYGDCT